MVLSSIINNQNNYGLLEKMQLKHWYRDTDQVIRKHVDGEDKMTRQIDGSCQKQNMTIIVI